MTKPHTQINIPLEEESPQAKSTHFRPIHYLGSKLRILGFLEEALDELDDTRGRVCDLFAGSGTVSSFLGQRRPVTSIDIQEYSRVLCSAALLGGDLYCSPAEFIAKVSHSDELDLLKTALAPLINAEEEAIDLAFANKPDKLCSFLESGSIISYQRGYYSGQEDGLENALRETSSNLLQIRRNEGHRGLISRHFGGVYFSFHQAAHLDAILARVDRMTGQERDLFLAALLSTVSDAVNTVGKQFAQPLQPRTREGFPKKNLAQRVTKDRSIDILALFAEWFERYQSLPRSNHPHRIVKSDFAQALRTHCAEASVIYADPPYTRDHYSRFYHALETICSGDDPEISTTKIGGRLRLSRGLYRLERHQSPFCIRSQAPAAFESLFSIVAEHSKPLVLSYSPYDSDSAAHPRVMTIDALTSLGGNYFNHISTHSPGALSHSKLNHSEKHLQSREFGEILIIFK